MDQEIAAGRKTETDRHLSDLLEGALLQQFQALGAQTQAWLQANVNPHGTIYDTRVGNLVKLMRMNAEMAGMLLRIDAARNRNSKTQ
jgi:hypothetical protein